MRILFSGSFNPQFEALPEYIHAALKSLGHEVFCFDHRARFIPGRLRRTIPPLDRMEISRINRSLQKAAKVFPPHVVLVNQGAEIESSTIASIKKESGACAINWWSDYPAQFDEGLALARSGVYDRFYVSGSDAESRHHAAGVASTRWLPFACAPSIHRPAPMEPGEKERFGVRVAFVGSAYPERRDLLAAVAHLGLGIWGPGWDFYRSDPEIGGSIRGGALRPEDWVRVFTASSVVLNLSYGFGGPPENYGSMANVRVFEALGCSACQVVDAKHDILDLFEDGRHLVTFRSKEELRRRVESLLADTDRRLAISREGRKEVLSKHTWEHRLTRIFDELKPRSYQLTGAAS